MHTNNENGSPEPKKTALLWTELGPQVEAVTADLPDDQREPIRWLYRHALEEGMTAMETARAVGMDGGTLNRVLSGKYAAKLAGIAEKIGNYRSLFEKRAEVAAVDFVPTETSRVIAQGCDWAHQSQSLTLIFGDSQIGKTSALEDFAAASEAGRAGHVRLVRMPASGSSQMMLAEIMRACQLTDGRTVEKMRDAILGHLNARHVLIVDELHQVFVTYTPAQAIKAMEILRELLDRSKCGLVLCGTNVLSREIKTGKMAAALSQLTRRGVLEINLPAIPPAADADAIAAAYGLPPARGEAAQLQDQILRDHGLGKFTKFLKAATRTANKAKVPIGWAHFLKAHAILESLKGGFKGGAN